MRTAAGQAGSAALALAAVLAPLCANAAYVPGEFGSLPILLTIPKVRAELALSPRQTAHLESLKERYKSRMRYLGVGGDASCSERAEAGRIEINREALAVLNPAQRRRLPAIERRAQGATLLYSPALRKELGLSPAQERRIEHIRAGGARVEERVNSAAQQGRITRQQRVELLRKERLKRARQIWDLLSPSQQRAFWKGTTDPA